MPEKLDFLAARHVLARRHKAILDPIRPAAPSRIFARGEVSRSAGIFARRARSTVLRLGRNHLGTRSVIWAAGVMASPAAKWLAAEQDRVGRVIVEPDLTLKGDPEIFVIGDTASVTGPGGMPLPGIAPVAKQEGKYVARVIAARTSGRSVPAMFRYRHLGTMATIGRKSAVVDFGYFRLSGLFAWLLWGMIHVYSLVDFRNRVVVVLSWLWAYVTFERGARLITGHET